MKTASSIGINIGPQDRAHRNQEASIGSAMRIRHWFCVMLVVLTCGMVAVAQQSNRTATGYQHSLNLTACGYGIGQCDEGLLSPAEVAQVSAVRHRMNVQACGYGIGQCDEGLLSPAEAAQVGAIRHRMNVQACGYGIGQCDEGLLSPAEVAQVSVVRHRMNVQACGYGIGQCSEGLLSSVEAAQVSAIRRRMNIQACEYGVGLCRKALLTQSEAAVVRSTKAGQESFVIPYPLTSMGETSVAPPTALDTQLNALLKALFTPASPSVAENGSYFGEPNNNGVPKTVLVNGYTRSNGTYVQGYYRSAPGTNPAR
jgi:hypothetical protein